MHWSKQAYLTLLPVYPCASLIVNGFRGDTFWAKLYMNKSGYEITDNDSNMFEEELIKVNDTLDIPFDDIKITISSSNRVSDEVFGITGFRYGADYVFPTRMLVKSPDEFRNYINEIFAGATGYDFNNDNAKYISDSEIKDTLLTNSARKFLYRRAIVKSTSYAMFVSRYAIWGACVGGCYVIFAIMSKVAGPILALGVSIPAACALFYLLFRASVPPQDIELDRRVYSIDENYAEGCKQFLESCIKFGLLMNRLNKEHRGSPFTVDGNPTDGHAAYTTRMEMLKTHINRKAKEEKAKKLRQL
jgi:hypothetical protein